MVLAFKPAMLPRRTLLGLLVIGLLLCPGQVSRARPQERVLGSAQVRPPGQVRGPATDRSTFRAAQRNVVQKVKHIADRLILRNIYKPHYQSRNQRWGFLRGDQAVSQGYLKSLSQTLKVVDRLQAQGVVSPRRARRLHKTLTRQLDRALAQTGVGKFPERLPLDVGSQRFMKTLQEFSGAAPQPFRKLDLLVDGPQWRRETHRMVATAKDFLHIASWAWHYDQQGTVLAHKVIARKLGLSFAELGARLQTQSVVQVRDSVLAQRLAQKEQLPPQQAARAVAQLPEARRRALVAELIEPLEVRVMLGNLIQGRERLKHPLAHVLSDMSAVGVQVVKTRKLFGRKAPFFYPQNLWAMTPHAKMMISRDEALTGGLNIGDLYLQRNRKGLVWHDAAMHVEGPVVHDLQRSFIGHWNRALKVQPGPEAIDTARSQGEAGAGTYYFPRSDQRVKGSATLVGTDDRSKGGQTTYSYRTALMMALASVKRDFTMVVPYLTSPTVVKQLERTARRLRAEGQDPSRLRVILTGAVDEVLPLNFLADPPAAAGRGEGAVVEAEPPQDLLHPRRGLPRQDVGGRRQAGLPGQRQRHGAQHGPGLGGGPADPGPGDDPADRQEAPGEGPALLPARARALGRLALHRPHPQHAAGPGAAPALTGQGRARAGQRPLAEAGVRALRGAVLADARGLHPQVLGPAVAVGHARPKGEAAAAAAVEVHARAAELFVGVPRAAVAAAPEAAQQGEGERQGQGQGESSQVHGDPPSARGWWGAPRRPCRGRVGNLRDRVQHLRKERATYYTRNFNGLDASTFALSARSRAKMSRVGPGRVGSEAAPGGGEPGCVLQKESRRSSLAVVNSAWGSLVWLMARTTSP